MPVIIARSSVKWFVGTSVLASSNVPFTLRTAFIVGYSPKSVSRFLEMPRRGERDLAFFASFFREKRKGIRPGYSPAGIRINEYLGQDYCRLVSSDAKTSWRGKNMSLLCSNSTAYAFTARGTIIPLPCGKWSCPECARTLAKEWAIRVKLGIDEEVAYFWTLTMSGKVRTAAYAFEILPSLWDVFRKRIQRAHDNWQYVAFVEGQPKRSNMPHFHIISLEKSPCRLKDLAVACGFGYQAYDEKVRGKRAAHYTAKYLTKQSPVTPVHFRRVRSSQDWPKLPEIEVKPLFIKRRGEFWFDFFMRVTDGTNLTLAEVIERWCDTTGMSFDEP